MESILVEDNPHWLNSESYNTFVPRKILPKAMSFMDTKEIVALIGARRVGKSTLAKLMIQALLKTVQTKNIFFINLQKPDFIPYKNSPSYLEEIFNQYLKLASPDTNKTIYFFIDEIQIFQHWEVFIKSKYENSHIKFIITGSNSSLLTSSYATLLTGRVLKLQIYSFSFSEFLYYKDIKASNRLQIVNNKIAIKRALDEYMQWGGYFSVISTSDTMIKKELLKNIAEDIILKDIVPRYKIKNSELINDLFYYVVSNTATLINYSSLAKKLNLDAKTVKEYIRYFEDNFLISTIPAFHYKLTEQIKSAKKLYINDNGFLNLGIGRSKDNGTYLENMVFQLLYKQDSKLSYLKENYEIDFYSHNTLFQVSYDFNDEKTKKRELNAFKYFKFKNRQKNKLITYNLNAQLDDVEIISLDEFFLDGT